MPPMKSIAFLLKLLEIRKRKGRFNGQASPRLRLSQPQSRERGIYSDLSLDQRHARAP